jgi:hypothetical protein
MTKHGKQVLFQSLLILFAVFSSATAQGDDDSKWRFKITPLYVWAAGLDGEATIKGFDAPVDLSFSDVLDQTDFAYMGHVEASSSKYVVMADVLYLDTGVERKRLKYDQEFFLIEGGGGYRLHELVEGIGGVRVVGLSASLFGTIRNDGENELVDESKTWVDPFVGFRAKYPIAESGFAFNVRFDIGGFGIGSELAWNVVPSVSYRISDTFSATAAYRYLDMDYEDGEESNQFAWDMAQFGPGVGVTVHF